LPAILLAKGPRRLKQVFVGAIALLLAAQVAMPWLAGGIGPLCVFLLVFFTAFNALEAHLPTLVSRTAPGDSRGVAIGVFSSLQFFGTFFGAAVGGFLYGRWSTPGVVIFSVVLLVIWLAAAAGTRMPETSRQRTS
jgi:predicted MFS family arabinose efflux permease